MAQNYDDQRQSGHRPKTSPHRHAKHHAAKLTELDVAYTRRMKGTMTQPELAAKFGIHREYVGKIQRMQAWD